MFGHNKLEIQKQEINSIRQLADQNENVKCKKLVTCKKTRLKCKEQSAKPSSKTKTRT